MMIRHIPVLLNETIDGLNLHSGDTVADATLGSGGHTMEILKRIAPKGKVMAMDADREAIDRCGRLAESNAFAKRAIEDGRLRFFHNNFAKIDEVLEQNGVRNVNALLADLGFSSDQMDDAERGFGFMQNGPLDMRLDRKREPSAKQVVNEYSERDLARVIGEYGDEPFAGRIAKAIVAARNESAIETTQDLANIVRNAIPVAKQSRKTHPATKTFQALRMEVNQEMGNLTRFLSKALKCLVPGGRMAIISFHSGEDRAVKEFFRENARGCICPKEFPVCRCGQTPRLRVMTKKPIMPSEDEVKNNPRARSAKLRIAEKVIEESFN